MMTRNAVRDLPPARVESVERQRALLRLLRQAAVHLATAEVLERRADRSASPALAAVLRERAGERRRRAERLRAELGLRDAPRRPLGPCPSPENSLVGDARTAAEAPPGVASRHGRRGAGRHLP
jgi:hypothetical protein